jgi:hypothetical protein
VSRVTGRIVVKETGVGIADLIIVVFDLDDTVTQEQLTRRGERLQKRGKGWQDDFWQKLSGNRLGSTLTDQSGSFELEYANADLREANEDKRPNLGLFVLAPEDASLDPCPVVLHISCGARPGAGQIETFLIKLQLETLQAAGISVPATASPPLESLGGSEVLAKMQGLLADRRSDQASGKPFSERYKERRKQRAEASGLTRRAKRPPQSFDLTLPVRFTDKKSSSDRAEIIQDKESGTLLLRTRSRSASGDVRALDSSDIGWTQSAKEHGLELLEAGVGWFGRALGRTVEAGNETRSVPLTFNGVRHTQDLGALKDKRSPNCLVVDAKKGELYFSTQRSTAKLVVSETGPSEPYQIQTRQRRRASSVDR